MRWARRSGNVWGWSLGASGRLFCVFWKGLGRGGKCAWWLRRIFRNSELTAVTPHPYSSTSWFLGGWNVFGCRLSWIFFHGPWEDHLIYSVTVCKRKLMVVLFLEGLRAVAFPRKLLVLNETVSFIRMNASSVSHFFFQLLFHFSATICSEVLILAAPKFSSQLS